MFTVESMDPVAAQLLVAFLALAGGGTFRTLSPSGHTRTNIEVIRQFLALEVAVVPEGRDVYRVDMSGRAGGA